MAFLHHDVCDSWLIVFLQFNAGISDGQELIVKNLYEQIYYKKYFVKNNFFPTCWTPVGFVPPKKITEKVVKLL